MNYNRISKKYIIGTGNFLRMWRRRNLALEGEIIVFKTLALSKFIFLVQVLQIPNEITLTIQRFQREFLWNSNNLKIKHKTICSGFLNEDSKNVNISCKISSLQWFLVKIYTTRNPMTGNWFQCISIIIRLEKLYFSFKSYFPGFCIPSVFT